jgi:hypothetical protein
VEDADIWRFRHGLIEDGRPTRHYQEAARINRLVRAIAAELDASRSVAVADSQGEIAAALPLGPLVGIEGGAVTVGHFFDTGHEMMLLVNRDYRQAIKVSLQVREGTPRFEEFDAEAGRWISGARDALQLGAGRAVLLRWPRTD